MSNAVFKNDLEPKPSNAHSLLKFEVKSTKELYPLKSFLCLTDKRLGDSWQAIFLNLGILIK